jgi:hypothetical protein
MTEHQNKIDKIVAAWLDFYVNLGPNEHANNVLNYVQQQIPGSVTFGEFIDAGYVIERMANEGHPIARAIREEALLPDDYRCSTPQ